MDPAVVWDCALVSGLEAMRDSTPSRAMHITFKRFSKPWLAPKEFTTSTKLGEYVAQFLIDFTSVKGRSLRRASVCMSSKDTLASPTAEEEDRNTTSSLTGLSPLRPWDSLSSLAMRQLSRSIHASQRSGHPK